MSLSVTVVAGYLIQDGETLTEAKLRLMAVPVINLSGTITASILADGSVTENKLSSSVAGAGLTGGAGAPLSVVTDNATVDVNGSNQVEVKDAGILLQKLGFGGFQGASAFSSGFHGLVPAPLAGQQTFGLCGNGTWFDFTGAAKTAVQNGPVEVFKTLNFE